jgi:hypothetical protein
MMKFSLNHLNQSTSIKLKSISKKIVEEHFQITLAYHRSLNYLFYMYKEGSRKNNVAPFILISELCLLVALNIIDKNEKESLYNMLGSEDSDNVYIALLSLENFRNQRIKIHGNWLKNPDVSKDFIDVAQKYNELVFTNKPLIT